MADGATPPGVHPTSTRSRRCHIINAGGELSTRTPSTIHPCDSSIDLVSILAVAMRRLLSVDSALFLATQLQRVPLLFSNVRHVVERGHIRRRIRSVPCTAGNSQSYDRQPTNYPLSQPFLFSINSLPIPVVAHSW
jgi:hypothetical protein